MTLSSGRLLRYHSFLCGFNPKKRTTILRGCGGLERGVNAGCGDGVHDRTKTLESEGGDNSAFLCSVEMGLLTGLSMSPEADEGGAGSSHRVMTEADSATKVSPIL